jgi:hypothetical protein
MSRWVFITSVPFVDRAKKIIIHNSESTVMGVGVLRSVTVLYLGKNGVVQINIVIPKEDYNRYSNEIIIVIES